MVVSRQMKSVMERIPRFMRQMLTFLLVDFAWILFRAPSFEDAGKMYRAIFLGGFGKVDGKLCSFFKVPLVNGILAFERPEWLVMAVFTVLVLAGMFFGRNVQDRAETMEYGWRTSIVVVFIMLLSLLTFSGVSTFVYFNF